jgi:hypothetical protein
VDAQACPLSVEPKAATRVKTSPAAPLTLHFLVTLFDKAFAFAILAFHFRFACVLLHVLLKSNTDCWPAAPSN